MKHVSRVKRSKFKQNDNKEPTKESSNEEKSLALPQFDKEGKIVGELIMPEQPKSKGDNSTESTNVPPRKKISFSIAIQPVPIQVKVELRRTGHNVTGRVIEIGGASDICSYAIEGEFRNLILACVYETESKEDIDRGSFSLMLRNNGKSLEGFFSSYANGDHAIAPMNCVLRKQGHFDLGSEIQGGEK
jgi:hypothetical protein